MVFVPGGCHCVFKLLFGWFCSSVCTVPCSVGVLVNTQFWSLNSIPGLYLKAVGLNPSLSTAAVHLWCFNPFHEWKLDYTAARHLWKTDCVQTEIRVQRGLVRLWLGKTKSASCLLNGTQTLSSVVKAVTDSPPRYTPFPSSAFLRLRTPALPLPCR